MLVTLPGIAGLAGLQHKPGVFLIFYFPRFAMMLFCLVISSSVFDAKLL